MTGRHLHGQTETLLMSIDTDTSTDGEQSIENLAESLGEAIADLPEYETFLEAKAAVETDEEAQEQIKAFEAARDEYIAARQRGEATRDELLAMQDKQEQLHEIPVMREYLQAENDLELRLQALNAHISEPLSIDFGEKAGGCCND